MIEQCPHCKGVLRFSQAHQEKLAKALEGLSQGRTLKFGCPKCKKTIELDKSGDPLGQAEPPKKDAAPVPAGQAISPPNAPDISWLSGGEQEDTDVLDDVPQAMVVMDDPGLKEKVAKALEENQYQISFPTGVEEAIESMRFTTYAVVAFSSGYGGSSLENQDFHEFMMKMSMKKRRNIFYIILGPEFETLYDLQALTFSANLVVNTKEIDHMPTLIKKGLKDYEALFAPYLSALKLHGKN